MINTYRILFTLVLLLTASLAQASDIAKEKRWAEQVVDAIFDGEVLMLNDGDLEFLAIYTPTSIENSSNAVILLHGRGVHPDWDQVIRPLRTGLPALGWSTLSLQMPVLANDAAYEEYAPLFTEVPGRIETGLQYLKDKGAKRVVIIGHSLGAPMGAYYLANNQPELVTGFIGIGMSGGTKHTNMDSVLLLKSISLPVLDLYGENDPDSILGTANARKKSASNPKSMQKMFPGADHFFDGQGEVLVKEIGTWLKGL